MSRFAALLDACVLVPITLTDTLLRLASEGLYRPLWSEKILDEAGAAVSRIHPELAGGKAASRLRKMDTVFEDACVMGWEGLVDGVHLPDANDRHVVAAAIRGRADLIVTDNVRDFPPHSLSTWEIEVQSADDFLLNQLDLDPNIVMRALGAQANALRRPPWSLDEVLDALDRANAPRFARAARAQKWRRSDFAAARTDQQG